MKICNLENTDRVKEIVDIHMQSFAGFFLTFLGKGFLKQLYKGFIEYPNSGVIATINNDNRIAGFLAYSDDLSGFYKFLIKKKIIPFAWYAMCAFFRKPKIMLRLLRAFSYSAEVKREEYYLEISSIGVLPSMEGKGLGSMMINALKQTIDSQRYAYIKLETDAEDNESVNHFYQKNGFVLDHEYRTRENRKMNEYRYYLEPIDEETA